MAVTVTLPVMGGPDPAIGPSGQLPFVQRQPDEAIAPKDSQKRPGNTWASILRLPQLWGGSWAGDEMALVHRIVLESIEYPPLKPEFLVQSKAEVQAIMDGKKEFPEASCRPAGMPRLVYYASGVTFMEEPGLVAIFTLQPRQVFMDGRSHPKELGDPNALVQLTTTGHSIGHWDGDTLVVDTVGVDPQTPIFYGVANGGGMHIVERYRLTGPDMLDLAMTVDAPAVLERPWVFHQTLHRRPEVNLLGDECDPAIVREKVDAQGNLKVDLSPPP